MYLLFFIICIKIVINYYLLLVYKYNIKLHSITTGTTNTMLCSVRLHDFAIYIACLSIFYINYSIFIYLLRHHTQLAIKSMIIEYYFDLLESIHVVISKLNHSTQKFFSII
jgi:hypothetical protein